MRLKERRRPQLKLLKIIVWVDGKLPRDFQVSESITSGECVAMTTPSSALIQYHMHVEENEKTRRLGEDELPYSIQKSWNEKGVKGRFLLLPRNVTGRVSVLFLRPYTVTHYKKSSSRWAVCIYSFVARLPRELCVKEGDVVRVLEELSNGWLLAAACAGQVHPDQEAARAAAVKKQAEGSIISIKRKKENGTYWPSPGSAFNGAMGLVPATYVRFLDSNSVCVHAHHE